jgi:NADH-quinone oxidoreductase subunit L
LSIVGGYVGIPGVLRVGPLAALHERFNLFDWLTPALGGEESHAAIGAARDTLLASAQPAIGLLQEAEHAAEEAAGHGLELGLMLTSIVVALAGITFAYLIYVKAPQRANHMYERFRGAYRVLWNKYWVDELYDALFVNRVKDAGDAFWVIDDALVDGVVNGTGNATKRGATASVAFDDMVVDGAVNAVGDELSRSSRMFRAWQTGYVQNYALIIALGIFLIVSAYLFL